MDDLRARFGKLLASHRRRAGLTQSQLAEKAQISVDMVSKIEIGASGARFPVIERLAVALNADPAEFFTVQTSNGLVKRRALHQLTLTLSGLSDEDVAWIDGIIVAAIKRPKL